MSHSARLGVEGGLQNPGSQPLPWLASTTGSHLPKALETTFLHALPPKTAGVPIHTEVFGNASIRQSVRVLQNDAASQNHLLRRPVGFDPLLKSNAGLRREIECGSSRHPPILRRPLRLSSLLCDRTLEA